MYPRVEFRIFSRSPELAPHVHIYLFSRTSLCRLMERAGFAIERAGSFHLDFRVPRMKSAKEFVWRSVQELGTAYGRLLDAGPMLYAVGTGPKAS